MDRERRVLVAYATRHGATMGIAERIATRLGERGSRVDLREAAQVDNVNGYDAVVLGSPVYNRSWIPEAAELARRHAAALAGRPVWLFSVGSFGDRSPLMAALVRKAPNEIRELQTTLRPRGYRYFAGVVEREWFPLLGQVAFTGLGGRWGDNRDWSEIDTWAEDIARALQSADEPPPNRLIERFIPQADIRERHEALIRAPADIVFDVAWNADMQAHPLVKGIFWLRGRLLRAGPDPQRVVKGLVQETTALGWGELALRPGRELVMGAVTQPWVPSPVFTAIPPERFADFAEPDLVKIVWTLEVEPLDPMLSRFRTETRVLATDQAAREKFQRYWRLFGVGIVLIRELLVPAVRREAERRAGSVG